MESSMWWRGTVIQSPLDIAIPGTCPKNVSLETETVLIQPHASCKVLSHPISTGMGTL